MQALLAVMNEEAFYQAKEAKLKLGATHWSDKERREGREIFCLMHVECTPDFVRYFRSLGFEVKFMPNEENPRMVSSARFIPMLENSNGV